MTITIQNWLKNTETGAIYPEGREGFKIYNQDNQNPLLDIYEECTPSNDRSGVLKVSSRRVGGDGGNNAFFVYKVDTPIKPGVFDIGTTFITSAKTSIGGWIFGQWHVTASPQTNHYGAVGIEYNMVERCRDAGFLLQRGHGAFTVALQIVPENEINVGDAYYEQGYNTSFGIAFCSSGPGTHGFPRARIHCPIVVEPGAIANNGVGIMIHGKDNTVNELNTPSLIQRFIGEFQRGISFNEATLTTNKAIELKPEHKIQLGFSSFISGHTTVGNGIILGTDHLFWGDDTRSIYHAGGNQIWYRWKDSLGNWNFQKICGPSALSRVKNATKKLFNSTRKLFKRTK